MKKSRKKTRSVFLRLQDQQTVDACNACARMFYSMHGYQVPEGFRFDQATHPQERSMWNLAAAAYLFIKAVDVDEALAALEADEES